MDLNTIEAIKFIIIQTNARFGCYVKGLKAVQLSEMHNNQGDVATYEVGQNKCIVDTRWDVHIHTYGWIYSNLGNSTYESYVSPTGMEQNT